jgi:predicted permease
MDRPVQVGSLTVTPRLFGALQTQPAAGQLFSDADERPGGAETVILTYDSWTRRFEADPAIIGETIDVDGAPRTVLGVTAEGFRFPPGDDEVELYFPMRMSDQVLLDRNHRMFDAVARLGEGATLGAARAELDAMATQLEREFPDSNEGWSLTAVPLRQELVGNLSATLWVLSGAVLLVLITACANIANLLVARATVTAREFAVRAALGARPRDLARRSLVESLLLGAIGGGLGLLLASWGTAILRSVIPDSIPRGDAISLDPVVLLFAMAMSLGATLLFGALPAARAVSPDLIELLKPAGAFGATGGGRRLREAMVVLEVAVAIVLLVAAGLMVRSFARLSDVDPGFRQQGAVAVAVQLPGSRYGRSEFRPFFERLVTRTASLPGVRAAGAVSDLPMSSVNLDFDLEFSILGVDSTDPTMRPNADFRLVVPGYFEAMDMRILAGRDFDTTDAVADRTVAIINETLATRYFRDLDPIGQIARVPMLGDVEVVGIVNDIRHSGLQSRYESEMFVPFGSIATGQMHVVAWADRDPSSVARDIGAVLAEMDAELAPAQIVAIEDLLWESVAQPRFNTALLSGLALSAALLAIVGTYGIVAYSVTRRTGEIGIRMALGASSEATVWLIVRQAMGVILAGAVLGLAVALGSARLLAELLFEVGATDPTTYALVLIAALGLGATAAWIPARRATRIDPVAALRDS